MHAATPASGIEPGILPIFRLFYGVMCFLTSLGFLSAGAQEVPEYFTRIIWAMCGVLTLYLSLPVLQRWLRRWYLPLALLLASMVPLLADYVTNVLYLSGGFTAHPSFADSSRLYFWLALPLLLISSQYTMRVMFGFAFVTSLLPIILAVAARLSQADIALYAESSVIRLLFYGVVGYVVVRITTAQREQRVELAAKNAQLAHYASTLEQLTIARERNRLARDLHDTLAHTLSAINVQLKALEVLWEQDPQRARAALQETQALTREGLHEARRALQSLRAAPIEELGLVMALDRLTRRTSERSGLKLNLQLATLSHTLPDDVAQHLYRVAEEAVNNVVRHAQAQTLSLSLQQSGWALVLTIADDGIGFDPDLRRDGHYGLVGMRERAILVNGHLSVQSLPGSGTTIRFEVPLEIPARVS